MSNTVTISFKVVQDGKGFKIIGQEAEKTAKQTDKATKSTDKFNKGQKGVAGAGMNSTKAFSKMRSEMGGSSGVVAAYATFAANVFALTAAFGALQRAAQLQNLETGFERLGNIVGRTSTMMAQSIQDITDGAISFDQAMRTAATGFAAGFSTSELESLARVARGAATALGRDLPDALDRLVRGTAKLEPEILDELGIFVKINDAATKYADTLGKSASQLTSVQRRQAFLNESITQGEKKFGAIADVVEVNTFDQLAANFDKIAKSALNLFSNVLSPVIGFLANNTTALLGTLVLFGSTLATSMFPALEKMAEKQLHVAGTTKKMADEEAKRGKKAAQAAKISFVKSPSSALTSEGKEFKAVADLKKDLKSGKADAQSFNKAIASINSTMKRTATIAKKNGKVNDKEHIDRMAQLKAQRDAIINVQAAESGRTGTSARATGLGFQAEAEEGVGSTLDNIRGASAGQGFKLAGEEFTKFRDKTSKGFEAMGKEAKGFKNFLLPLSKGFKLAGAGARLFGAALVNAIPFIGQIIFIAGLAVQGLKALFNALTKPTKAEAQLAEITEKLESKTKQLKETNEGLATSYLRIELDKAIREGKDLTDALIDQAVATAEARTKVQSYANEVAVAAGVLDEYSASVGNLADEIAAQSGEGGIFANLGNFAGDIADDVGGFLSSVGNGIVGGIKSAGDTLVQAGGIIADDFSKATVSVVGLVNEDFAENVEMSGVTRKMNAFRDGVVDSFGQIKDGLDEAGIGGLVNDAFDGKTLEEYVNTQLASIDMTKGQEHANEKLKEVMKRVEAQVQKTSATLQQQSDGINKFEENVKDGAAALRLFATKAKESNEFTKLGENLQLVSNAVKELKVSADGNDELTFAAVLDAQIKAGKINLDDYGTTAEQVVQNVKDGKDPFEQLKNTIALAADEVANGKAKLDEMKTALKALKTEFDVGNKAMEFAMKMETLAKTGDFKLSGAQKSTLDNTQYANRVAFIEQELKMNNEIAAQEMKLADLKLDILIAQNAGNTEIVARLNEQKDALAGQLTAQQALNAAKAQGQTIDAESTFFTTQDSNVKSTLSAAGQGDTAYERATNFKEAGGFGALEKTDAEGNKLGGESGENMKGKLQAMQEMINPQLESLKKLGPEGELIAAVTEGSFAMGEAFVTMNDTISTASNGLEKGAATAAFAGQAIASIGSMMAANSKAKISAIDKEIAAEKSRDGQSDASMAKIKAMEKKRESIKRKEFETNKKMQMGQVVANTAAGIMGVLSGIKDPIVTAPMAVAQAAMIGVMGAAQLATISKTSFQGGGGSAPSGPSKISVGSRSNTVDMARGNNPAGELAYARGAKGVGTGMTDYRPAFSGYKHRYGGGYVVGEQGPELFMPDTSGTIIPADETEAVTQTAPVNVNFTIQAIDTQNMQEALTVQRGNIIEMIREAANTSGEQFLESVDTFGDTSQLGDM